MKKYKVDFWYTEYGTAYIDAESKEDAESKVYKHLEEFGLEVNQDFEDLQRKTNDRDYGSQDAEQILEW